MPASSSNLPSLDGQRRYMVTRNLSTLHIPKTEDRCAQYPLNATECEHDGQTIILLRLDNDTLLFKHHQYKVKCDEHGKYYIKHKNTVQYTINYYDEVNDVIRIAADIMLFSCKPHKHFSFARGLIGEDVFTNPHAHINYNILELLFSKKNKYNSINTKHAKILFDIKNIEGALHLNEINDIYVNMVHDCHTACAQSVLDIKYNFMSVEDMQYYGLLCTHKLVEMRPEITTHTLAQTTSQEVSDVYTTQAVLCLSVSAALLSFGAAAAFVCRSDGALATQIRRCITRVKDAVYGMRRVQRYDSIQELLPVGEHCESENLLSAVPVKYV